MNNIVSNLTNYLDLNFNKIKHCIEVTFLKTNSCFKVYSFDNDTQQNQQLYNIFCDTYSELNIEHKDFSIIYDLCYSYLFPILYIHKFADEEFCFIFSIYFGNKELEQIKSYLFFRMKEDFDISSSKSLNNFLRKKFELEYKQKNFIDCFNILKQSNLSDEDWKNDFGLEDIFIGLDIPIGMYEKLIENNVNVYFQNLNNYLNKFNTNFNTYGITLKEISVDSKIEDICLIDFDCFISAYYDFFKLIFSKRLSLRGHDYKKTVSGSGGFFNNRRKPNFIDKFPTFGINDFKEKFQKDIDFILNKLCKNSIEIYLNKKSLKTLNKHKQIITLINIYSSEIYRVQQIYNDIGDKPWINHHVIEINDNCLPNITNSIEDFLNLKFHGQLFKEYDLQQIINNSSLIYTFSSYGKFYVILKDFTDFLVCKKWSNNNFEFFETIGKGSVHEKKDRYFLNVFLIFNHFNLNEEFFELCRNDVFYFCINDNILRQLRNIEEIIFIKKKTNVDNIFKNTKTLNKNKTLYS